ncbi:MAG: hypothetical protein LBJ11_09885 [Oscillospiraceae bacterium]|jgi:hypothetical protein|nr:hypothetical protein [Oscillospiraceae bacterium]
MMKFDDLERRIHAKLDPMTPQERIAYLEGLGLVFQKEETFAPRHTASFRRPAHEANRHRPAHTEIRSEK